MGQVCKSIDLLLGAGELCKTAPNEGINEFNGWRGHTWLISATWCLPGQTKMPSTETMLVG